MSSNLTLYFGYGSNLWLSQMHSRCPRSTYIGIARLNDYKWIINDRGYANVVELSSSSSTSSSPTAPEEGKQPKDKSRYTTSVYGLVYTLHPSDESRLDKNEGVPIAYTKEFLACDFWSSDSENHKVDTSLPPTTRNKPLLVYIDRKRTTPDEPKREYVYRMNRGIEDALRMGVPRGYVDKVMRKFIEEESDDNDDDDDDGGGGERREEARKRTEELARMQAVEFRDESGVF